MILTLSDNIVSFVYYNSLIRDTLEYTMKNNKFEVNFYNYKKYGIINELKLNTPLKSFLDKNSDNENGPRVLKLLTDLGEEIYGDKSSIIKFENNEIKVDHAQDLKIFESVLKAHEEVKGIINFHYKFILDNKQKIAESIEQGNEQYKGKLDEVIKLIDLDIEKLTKLLRSDENFYRAVAIHTISSQIFDKYHEFNVAMRESNGQKTPQASFVEKELQQLIGFIHFIFETASTKDELFTNAKDKVNNSIEMMSNKRALPAGKNFNDVFSEVRADTVKFLVTSQEEWKLTYGPLVEEMKNDFDRMSARAKELASKNNSSSENVTADAQDADSTDSK